MQITQILDQIAPQQECEYWDVRIEESFSSDIVYEDFELITYNEKPSLGAFVRVYNQKMWFYTSTTDLEHLSDAIDELIEQSNSISFETTETNKPYNTSPLNETLLRYAEQNCTHISAEDKLALCRSYFEAIKTYDKLKNIVFRYTDLYKNKYFKSSNGISFNYDFCQYGLSCSYNVIEGDKKFSDGERVYANHFENLSGKQEQFKKAIEESYLFLDAETITAGSYPVVMHSEVVGVFAHESFGHKSEADFMLGDPNAKEAWKIGDKVGSEILSIVDYGGDPDTSGYCPIDDEGFPTQKTHLIKDGLLSGRLHSKLTAAAFDEEPTGNARAINFEFEPIVRMTNTYIEAGESSFDELLSQVEKGVFVKDYKHGSGLSTFTIAPKKCYMIREGKLAEPVRVSVVSGSVFETLGLIEGCSDGLEVCSEAFGGCGKGEQFPLPVSHGGPQILISKLMVS